MSGLMKSRSRALLKVKLQHQPQIIYSRRFKSNDNGNDVKGEANESNTHTENGESERMEKKEQLEEALIKTLNESPGNARTNGKSEVSTIGESQEGKTEPHHILPLTPYLPTLLPLHVQQILEKVNSMSFKELQTQKFLDGDKPFLSTKADGFLVRKNLIRDLPDKIDLFDEEDMDEAPSPSLSRISSSSQSTSPYPMETLRDIHEIYSDLSKLDSDESMHRKYFEKYGIRPGQSNDIVQGFNGINEKFSLLRRGETLQLGLSPNNFRFEKNMFNMPYNVPGFDVSFSGIPLRFGEQKLKKRQLPLELVKDLRMYTKSVPIRKGDLAFDTEKEKLKKEEEEEMSVTIHPKVDTVVIIDKVKLLEKDCIETTKSLSQYNPFPSPAVTSATRLSSDSSSNPVIFPSVRSKFETSVEFIISRMQRSLVKEIEVYLGGVYKSPDSIFKPNSFYLFEKKKPKVLTLWNKHGTTEISLPIQLAKLSSLPLSVYYIKTKKEKRFLRLHLFKIFMINLEGLIDRLITMKYQTEDEKNSFLSILADKVYTEIDNVLLNEIIREFKVPSKNIKKNDVGVIMYSPFKNGSFKRIIWTRNGWGNLKHHQRSKIPTIQVKKVELEKVLQK
ncbi:hypothetical protein CLIB1423_08S03818 [[Candida] railenensis]|uniref:Uncharacterized protein n=1 Tax=[Candida] railenensis TaxID=45579 RepID=A0A9P0QQ87_9ASCO|nr:hypothetical protein CLIB1423_08S03818 [[Candida] railenensis]